MMLPLPCSFMTRTSCFMLRITPSTFVSNVCIDELGLGTIGTQLVDERLARFITPAGDNYFRALFGEGDGGGAPDTGQCSGNQNNLGAHGSSPPGYGLRARQKLGTAK